MASTRGVPGGRRTGGTRGGAVSLPSRGAKGGAAAKGKKGAAAAGGKKKKKADAPPPPDPKKVKAAVLIQREFRTHLVLKRAAEAREADKRRREQQEELDRLEQEAYVEMIKVNSAHMHTACHGLAHPPLY